MQWPSWKTKIFHWPEPKWNWPTTVVDDKQEVKEVNEKKRIITRSLNPAVQIQLTGSLLTILLLATRTEKLPKCFNTCQQLSPINMTLQENSSTQPLAEPNVLPWVPSLVLQLIPEEVEYATQNRFEDHDLPKRNIWKLLIETMLMLAQQNNKSNKSNQFQQIQ